MKHLASFALIVVLVLLPLSHVVAESQAEIRINLISTLENEDAMLLKLYFNLYDPSSGAPYTSLKTTDAQITLLKTSYNSTATIKAPDVPIYVTLVLDSSGSMAGSAQKLRDSAKLALNNPPDDSFFAVVQFDEEIKLLQDFTENMPAVSYAIDQYQTSFLGTCLYDAAYSAVEAQSNAPPGRRAVILFTDGTDEKRDGTQCSKHSYQELVSLALELQVPIHTIGLSSTANKLNEAELKSMAGSTGGFSFVSNQDDLPQTFTKIMDALKAQWMVETYVYPQKGENEAVFSLTLDESGTVNTAFTFNSETDYSGPPSPVQLQFDGLQLIAETQSYDLQLALTSPELVAYVKISLWDKDAGSKVTEFIFENPDTYNAYNIPTTQMVDNRKYELRMIAVSKEDGTPFTIYTTDRGDAVTEMIHEFRFDPSSIYASAVIDSVTQQGNDLVLNVSLTNSNMIGGFDGWLVDKQTNTQVTGSQFNISASTVRNGQITVPTKESRIPSGQYTVVLRVLNTDNQVLMTTQYEDVVYKAPGVFQHLFVALKSEPIYLAVVVGIILAVIIYLMVSSSKQKALSGTPVMQGQLGKKMKKNKEKLDGLQAIATEEPILTKSPPSPIVAPVAINHQPEPQYVADDTRHEPRQEDSSLTKANLQQTSQPYLTGIRGPKIGSWKIEVFPYIIGRQEGSLVLKEQSISRKHAQITCDGNLSYYITDLNSSNGTKLNGQRLLAGKTTALTSGSTIELGSKVTFQFDLKSDS